MPAAIPIAAAGIGVAGSVVAGNKAAKATNKAAASAAQVQREGLEQQERLSAPYRAAGETALKQYQSLLGLTPSTTSPTDIIKATPGYDFRFQEGQKVVQNAASATGSGLGGNTLRALVDYGQGRATDAYGDYADRLESLSSLGQAAAAGQAAATGNTASNLSNIETNRGESLANIGIGTVGGVTGALSGAFNDYTTMNTLRSLSRGGGADPWAASAAAAGVS